MRLYGVSRTDVETVVACPRQVGIDEHGNQRLAGLGRGDRAIIVVVACDDPDFVITTFPDD